jgi:lysophospholipase L1-like esterase
MDRMNGMAPEDRLGELAAAPGKVSRVRWIAVLLLIVGVWVCRLGYQLDLFSLYVSGIAASFILLLLIRRLWRGWLVQNLANTVILLIVLICVSDAFRYRRTPEPGPVPLEARAWTFEVARGNPALFRAWWQYVGGQWNRFFRELRIPDPDGVLPFRLRPGAEVMFVESRIRINSQGFRNREFEPKGDAFRIVALGESTTMGVTIRADDKPWPVWLQEMLAQDDGLNRPVQVINAGVAAYRLEDNVARFVSDILPLEPDLILSYHGYNSFEQLRGDWAATPPDLPNRISRPSPTLESIEHAMRLWRYRRSHTADEPDELQLEAIREGSQESAFGRQYMKLVELTGLHRIPLILIRYNMAIDAQSPPAIVKFYGRTYLSAPFDIQANRIHTELIETLAKQHAHVSYINASDGVDGVHAQFIDLVHLTEDGRKRLAHNLLPEVLRAIDRRTLESGAR